MNISFGFFNSYGFYLCGLRVLRGEKNCVSCGELSDINVMQITTSQTKVCPFCAETILSAAIKCRFCGEFLNTERAKALMRGEGSHDQAGQTQDGSQQDQPINPNEILFSGQPSLWIITSTIVKFGTILIAAIFLMFWHIEKIKGLNLSFNQAITFAHYRILSAILIALIVGSILLYKIFQVRMMHYEVSADRIEFGQGLLDRKVDNLDMFRVTDIKLRRSFFDCIVGVGTVYLTTTDKSHPEFTFVKVRHCHELYDIIKKSSLSADRRTNVIHME